MNGKKKKKPPVHYTKFLKNPLKQNPPFSPFGILQRKLEEIKNNIKRGKKLKF